MRVIAGDKMRQHRTYAEYPHPAARNDTVPVLTLRGYLLVTVFSMAAGSLLLPGAASAGSPALPSGGRFAAGQGQIGSAGPGNLTVNQSTPRGIIDWQKFAIGAGGTVRINNGSGATLNRVTGGDLSRIDGSLSGTGSIYVINPNGVVVGPGGKVVTGGSFVASTRDIPNAQFMAGGTMTAAGTSAGTVTNEGKIIAKDGNVVMIGQSVTNTGGISAHGTAALVAGNRILLAPVNGPDGVYVAPDAAAKGNVTNSGSIRAAAAALQSAGGNVYALAGNRQGIVEATGTATINGQVWLSAPNGQVSVTGSLKARNADGSGGAVIADGRDVSIGSGARISADGSQGGTVLIGVAAAGGKGEAARTVIADGARIIARGRQGGHIETSGKTLQLGHAAISAGTGGSWLIDPTDLTINSAAASTIDSSLNAGTSVTEQTTSSSASGAGTQSSGLGDITISAPISWSNAAASLNILAYHAINVNAAISGAGGVLMSAGGNLTIASGASITGDAGVTLGMAGNFINNAGASAVSAGASGRWLIYSTNPASDTDGGLTPNFIQYAASFPAGGSGATTPAQSTGNGFLYSATPSVTLSLTGTVTKTYDATTTAPLTSANYGVSGLINGDTGVLAGTYGTANAGSGIAVTAAGFTAYHGSAAIPVYGYSVANPGVAASIGAINPAPITETITGNPAKVYDGTTTATLTAANYSLSGFVAGQSATVSQPASVAYAAASAGPQTITASFVSTDFVAGSGTNLANYQFVASASGAGTINQAPLDITGILATNKTYDRTANDPLDTSKAGLYGVIGGDTVTLSTTGALGSFASPNAGNNLAVTASGFTLSGAQAADYRLVEPPGLAASIAPAPLSIQGVAATNKTYDGTTADPLAASGASLTGVVSGDSITLSSAAATGAFASANAGTGIAVSASGFSISGAQAANYTLAQPSGLAANISPASLNVSVTGNPSKTYDATSTAVIPSGDYTLSGFVTGQSAIIGQAAMAQYASANAGSQTVNSTLVISDYLPASGTSLSNYILPTTATGTGTINQAPVSVLLVGNPQKVYDGTMSASLGGSNFFLTGFVAGQGATVSQASGTYASANVGVQGISVNLIGQYTPNSGTLLSNYLMPSVVTGYGTITPAPLTGHVLATITNDPTKSYDGTTAATLTSADFSLAGFATGQGATVTQTAGQYATPNAGVQPVTATLTSSDFTPNSGTNLANYTLPTAAYGTGTINPAVLTAMITGNPTKYYNGTTTGVLGPSNLSVSGFASGQGVAINQSALVNYGAASAGSQSVTATLATTDFTADSGTDLTNYVLPATATGTGTILPAKLTINGVAATSKVYDTTTADALNTGAAALAGVVGSDTITLSSQSATGIFASANAGSGIGVTASGFSISGANAADYQLIQPIGLAANITPAALSITGVTANNKAYDGTRADTLSVSGDSLSGVLGSDSVTLSNSGATGSFGSVNIGTGLAVAASGFTISGAQASNYSLNQPGGLSANIIPAPLTALITGNPTKTYDASTSTTLVASDYTIDGFVAGQGASLPQTASASYASANAGPESITATLVTSDFAANAGTSLANYALPATGAGTGTINQAPVTARIIGNPTKTYDATAAATLTPANFSLSGFLGGQSASVTQSAGAYGSPSAGAEPVTASLAPSDFTPGSGTLLANYALPVMASGPGTINRALLGITGVTATNKIYNDNTADTLNASGAAVSGLQGSDTVNLSSAGATGAFASVNVGTGIGVTAAGFTISGGESTDYTLAQPTGLAADITQATLNLASVRKVYDSTTGLPTSSAAYTLSGIYGADTVSLDTTGLSGSYAAKNVGTSLSVSISGLALTGAQAANYLIGSSVTADPIGIITPAPLGITGVTANNKIYDNTTAATLNSASAALSGEFAGDTVNLSSSGAAGVFASPNAGSNIAVTASGYTISGADAANYTLSQPAGLAATITPDSAISLASVTKTYDSTTGLPASNAGYTLNGVLGSNNVSVNASGLTGSFASSDVGSGLNVTISGITLTGAQAGDYSIGSSVAADPIGTINPALLHVAIINNPTKTYDATTAATLTASNYSLTGFAGGQSAAITQGSGAYGAAAAGSEPVTASLTSADFNPASGTSLSNYTLPTTASGPGTITQAGLIITGVMANNKVYNDSTYDTLSTGSAALSGVVSGDTVNLSSTGASGTFASLNVGNGISVTAHGFTISGAQAGNYTLTQPAGLAANITPATLTLTSVKKLYDSTTALPTSSAAYTLSGIYGTDTVSLDPSGLTGAFAAKTVGTGLSVSASGLTLTGAQQVNYQIASSVTANPIGIITPATLTVIGEAATTKVYDGTVSDTLNNAAAALQGVLGSDTVTLGSPATGSFASPNAGSGIAVTATGYTISGADAGNYILTEPSGLAASITPAPVSVALAGNPTKTYDASTAATLSSANYALSGLISGQSVTVNQAIGAYASANAGTEPVSASLAAGNFIPGSGTLLSNYSFASSASGAGTINPAALTAAITGTPTKTYDGTTSATLTSNNYSLSGFIAGQGATIAQPDGVFSSANTGADTVSAVLTPGAFTSNGGTLLSNYVLPTSAAGAGQINQAILSASIIGTPAKTYDGTAAAFLTSGDYAITGFVQGQSATIAQPNGSYASANAGAEAIAAALTAGDFTAGSGTLLSNYVLPANASGAGQINQAPLGVSIIGNPAKTYDGTSAASLAPSNYSLTGFIAGQGASVTQSTGAYASPNAGTEAILATLAPGDFSPGGGTSLANYVLPANASGAGTINQAILTAAITGTPAKTYDGTIQAALTPGDFTLSGFVAGESASITQNTGSYVSANAGAEAVTAGLASANFLPSSGTLLANYSLPTSAAGTGLIGQAPLQATIIGNPTKIYDGGTAASLAPNNYSLSGFASGQGAAVNQATGSYGSANAGPEAMSATLASTDFVPGTGTNLANYILPASASGTGTINQALLTAAITGNPIKTYDGTTVASLTPGDFTLAGFVAGQGAAIAQTSGSYAAANAGTEGVSVNLAGSGYTPNSGTILSNYIVPTSASGTGTINQAALTAAITGNPSKAYDGTTLASLTPNNFTLSGFVAGQGATVSQATGAYAAADAGTEGVATSLAAADFTAGSGTNLANYILPTNAAGFGAINPAALTAVISSTPTKTYDGGTAARLAPSDFALSGFIPGQSATITQSAGAYASANAGAEAVTANLAGSFLAGAGTNLSNYALPASASGTGTINQAILTAAITGTPSKIYDGTTSAALLPGNFTLSGFIGGQGASVNQPAGVYASANAGPEAVSTQLVPGNFAPNAGTLLSNYVLPASATGGGVINQAPLSVSAQIIGDPTKTYDGGTATVLAPGNFLLSGFVTGQGATVTKTTGTYGSPNAGAETIATSLSQADFLASQDTNLANYILPAIASGTGTINQAILNAVISGTPLKTYDGTTHATLTANDFTISGFVAGQGAVVTQTTGRYASANAGTEAVAASLAGSNFTPNSGTLLSNYILPTAALGTGAINQALLTAAITGNPDKIYDGTIQAALTPGNFTLSGFVAGQGASVTQTAGAYASANAGAEAVATSLTAAEFTAGPNTLLSNYILPSSAVGFGAINPTLLTITGVSATNKSFDGSRADKLSAADAALRGVVSGSNIALSTTNAAGLFASSSPGNDLPVTASGFRISGADAANYTLLQPRGLTATISPATLTAAVIGNLADEAGISAAAAESTAATAIAGVTPVINIPFPAPSGLSTRGGTIFGSLPVILLHPAAPNAMSSGTDTLSSNQPLIVSPEEILLQGIKDKVWHITLPSSPPLTNSAKLQP